MSLEEIQMEEGNSTPLEESFAKVREMLGIDVSAKIPEGDIEIGQWSDIFKLMPSVINFVENSFAGKDVKLVREKMLKGDCDLTEFIKVGEKDFEELHSRVKFTTPILDTL